MILGKNLIMTLGDNNRGLAASKSCNLSIDTDFIEVCSPVEGSWKEYLPTIKSWSASIDTLVASLSDHKALLQKQDNNEMLFCCFFDNDFHEFYKGNCYIKNIDLKASVGGLATMSVGIQPTGKLNWSEETEINMTHGVLVAEKYMLFNSTNYVMINHDRDGGIYLQELIITQDTRITLPSRGMVIKASASDAATMINALNDSSLNANAIMVNEISNTSKSVVIKKQASAYPVTILVNSGDSNQPVITLSKF